MTFEVIENFFPTEFAFELEQRLFNGHFAWVYNNHTSSNLDDSGYGYHTISAWLMGGDTGSFALNPEVVDVIMKQLVAKDIMYIRNIKFNLYTRTQEIVQHGKHFDVIKFRDDMPWSESSEKTIIYYVNDNNGYTEFFPNGKDSIKVPSKFNTALYTDENMLHCSSTCTDKPARITININFK
jgi:hypothetical protein|tara:strand:+ start:195 stop:740 length:546 start_codon:yes stop_codon:yes gene_type:complete